MLHRAIPAPIFYQAYRIGNHYPIRLAFSFDVWSIGKDKMEQLIKTDRLK
jgi:hypothetical protein